MNFKGISYYLGLFCFPISILAFINILYSSYFDYFLSITSYISTLVVSFVIGSSLLFLGRHAKKKINFIEEFNNYILISVPTRFIRDWITSRYLDQILQIVKLNKRDISRIEFNIMEKKDANYDDDKFIKKNNTFNNLNSSPKISFLKAS